MLWRALRLSTHSILDDLDSSRLAATGAHGRYRSCQHAFVTSVRLTYVQLENIRAVWNAFLIDQDEQFDIQSIICLQLFSGGVDSQGMRSVDTSSSVSIVHVCTAWPTNARASALSRGHPSNGIRRRDRKHVLMKYHCQCARTLGGPRMQHFPCLPHARDAMGKLRHFLTEARNTLKP